MNIFIENLELNDRVIFTGSILDKNKLIEEYESDKIFALPSMLERGSPNVISEALTAGCVNLMRMKTALQKENAACHHL